MEAPTLTNLSSGETEDRAITSDGITRLALNHPPPVPAVFNDVVSDALSRVFARTSPADLVATHRWMGTEIDRQQGAVFAARRLGGMPNADRVIVAHSTQAALHMLLPGMIGRGGHLAVEQMTYPPVRSFAERYGIHVTDVAIDGDGLDPNAFEDLCKRGTPSALYLLSTYQNPTTVTMSLDRRREIAAIARRYHVKIIEDDIYSLLSPSPLPPISALIPELSWYLLGTAKSFSAGLKLAFVVAPDAATAARTFWPGVRATYWMASPVSAALMADLISTGGDVKILSSVKLEVAKRHADTLRTLPMPIASDPGCLHVWIPLRLGLSSTDVAEAILRQGVQVAASDSYAQPGWKPPQAIRIGIGNPSSQSVLLQALKTIASVLSDFENDLRPHD
ncbi:PLP-dependent aminotransferase family protein [Sinorhizobium meliloti]|uniref:aminotransferase-like domain-containing protein n=1 Tax=Rhizobium meliloti TaxID=382 RepID=UPI000FDB04AE|nr:PLP-dependent aminotransferase family protein [Sinorhizobium meliloti]RVE82141.1 PLP-dependent aminotransferase family protein [Sinorhizobium meliloti]RVH24048.1 PLP-dependent aminotransferase family protein [Sinorhizobium meliloti]